MKAEDILNDMATVLFEPEITAALQFYNLRHNQGRENTVAADLLRKREVLYKAYQQYRGQKNAGRVPEPNRGNE
jgi:hypothetical protein